MKTGTKTVGSEKAGCEPAVSNSRTKSSQNEATEMEVEVLMQSDKNFSRKLLRVMPIQ